MLSSIFHGSLSVDVSSCRPDVWAPGGCAYFVTYFSYICMDMRNRRHMAWLHTLMVCIIQAICVVLQLSSVLRMD
jgi:hypothetical protein